MNNLISTLQQTNYYRYYVACDIQQNYYKFKEIGPQTKAKMSQQN